MVLTVITPPTEWPVTREEVKKRSNIDFNDEDTEIDLYISGVVNRLDGPTGILGRYLMAQTVRHSQPCFDRIIRLPVGVTSIDAVSYYDEADALTAFTGWELSSDASGSFLRFKDSVVFPAVSDRLDAVQVTFNVGWTADNIPASLKIGIIQLADQIYENPSSTIRGDGKVSKPVIDPNDWFAPWRMVGV